MTDDVAQEQPGLTGRDPNVLISLVACTATAALALSADGIWHAVRERPGPLLAFVGLALVLQLVSIELYGHGSFSFGGVGLLALGFTFGSSPAMAVGALMGVANLIARRRHGARLNRGVFDAAQFSLAAGAGAAVFDALAGPDWSAAARILPSIAAGVAYMVVNIGLLSLTIALAEGESQVAVWRERFRWLTPYFLAAGPLSLGLVVAYENVGLPGLIAFVLPPALLTFSTRQYESRTRQSVEEVRAANEKLRTANAQLAERNDDLHALFQFAGGLAARAHDRAALIAYAERELSRLTGSPAEIRPADGEGGIELLAGDSRVGGVHLGQLPGLEGERWNRLREAILPQLATAIESADLVEHARRRHLGTIAALARSMEAKDYYTGGHTQRVCEIAVAVAARLGYAGEELDAIQIGALLHDIGKIGIPERILHKPGPLDEEEWRVMKGHPVISEYILSEVDLHPIVMQIARSSHERIDGTGYPDGLPGGRIPMSARIVLVADAFDALTSDRPYRSARTVAAAMDELRANTGTQFCTEVVAALEAVHREQPQILGAARLRAVGGAAA